MEKPPRRDPYALHDPSSTARFAGLVWMVYGTALLGLSPVVVDAGSVALVAGAVTGAVALVGGAALLRTQRVPYSVQLALCYAGVAVLALLQELYGRVDSSLITSLYLIVTLQAAALHPLRRSAGVLVGTSGALVLHWSQVGWSGHGAADLAVHMGVFLLIALIANSLVAQLREQRELARSEHAEANVLAHTDCLTGLGNRRGMMAELEGGVARGGSLTLALFDLDGFKDYNDRFGHPAGDALLRQLGANLRTAVSGHGTAYRTGGDEFCVLVHGGTTAGAVVAGAAEALSADGEAFSVSASYGCVTLPDEARTSSDALRVADRRMYARKAEGRTSAGRQSTDVLVGVLHEREPELGAHLERVARMCERVAERLDVPAEERAALRQAAALHDIGKAAIPDAILGKAGPLEPDEWEFMTKHPVIGERILSAAPSLTRAAQLVRWSHERIDGRGYPDGLHGEEIPLCSRIIAACHALEAMLAERPYRRAMTLDDALAAIRRGAGTQFDAAVVRVLGDVAHTLAREAGGVQAGSRQPDGLDPQHPHPARAEAGAL